jgi:hypothetical protein
MQKARCPTEVNIHDRLTKQIRKSPEFSSLLFIFYRWLVSPKHVVILIFKLRRHRIDLLCPTTAINHEQERQDQIPGNNRGSHFRKDGLALDEDLWARNSMRYVNGYRFEWARRLVALVGTIQLKSSTTKIGHSNPATHLSFNAYVTSLYHHSKCRRYG